MLTCELFATDDQLARSISIDLIDDTRQRGLIEDEDALTPGCRDSCINGSRLTKRPVAIDQLLARCQHCIALTCIDFDNAASARHTNVSI